MPTSKNFARFNPQWVGLIALLLCLFIGLSSTNAHSQAAPSRTPAQAAANPWVVFTPATNTLPMSGNLLLNPGFESGTALTVTNWLTYVSGYTVDPTGGHNGGRALRLTNAVTTAVHGAYQIVTLNQTQTLPIYLSAWSKADNVSGNSDTNYSVYLDIHYMDNTPLYGQTVVFATGTHDWQQRERFIVTTKPIKDIYVYCLFRNTHTGTVWLDDVRVSQVQAAVADFDSVQVATTAPLTLPYSGPNLTLTTNDGLSLTLAAEGGAVTQVALNGTAVQDSARAYLNGFFVRDVAAQSDFYHFGGSVIQQGNTLHHTSMLAPLALNFNAAYTATADRIAVHAELTNTASLTRAVTLYFALPISATNWLWGDDIRAARTITGLSEFANFSWYTGLGANNHLSEYPWASLSGPAGGVALGIPLDSPRALRLIYNPATQQFYAAFDLGLSPFTTKFPNRAWVDFVIYPTAPDGGFRAAAQGYYDRFPQSFVRRMAPEREGIWVAFSSLAPITDVQDFGIGVHEISGLSYVGYDDSIGVQTFRYVSEPWSHWFPITTTSVDVNNYDQVIAYLQQMHQIGSPAVRNQTEATLSSGFFDENGRYRYYADTQPWCVAVGQCAVFTLNPDPDIVDPTYPMNAGNLDWNATVQQAYTTTPGLEGEYIDSYLAYVSTFDFRTAHFAATDVPLTFRPGDWQVGIPEVFATTDFARALTRDVHERFGKLTMANGTLLNMAWGSDLFDYQGRETDWFPNNTFTPESDAFLNYYRTLVYQRPYGMLMNTNFANLSHALVERYFQITLFYGIYPSMFSENAAENPYWADPSLYNRDRDLFRRYIPLIRRLNTAGWQPMTYATTSDANVYIERFGTWPNLHFTLRNMLTTTTTVTLTLQANALNLPATPLRTTALLANTLQPLSLGPTRTLTLTLAPQASEIIAFADGMYLPLVQR